MPRRWIIRCIFTFPILLSLAGWAWSCGHDNYLRYVRPNSWGMDCSTFRGVVGIGIGEFSVKPGWFYRFEAFPTWQLWPLGHHLSPPRHAGFAIGRNDYQMWLVVPYWFLIAVFGVILFCVWRKTRPKITPAHAFAVEVKAQA